MAYAVGVRDVHLRAVDGLHPQRLTRLRVLHGAEDAVVVGQRQRAVAQLSRRARQLIRQGGAVQEREGGVGVELDVHAL